MIDLGLKSPLADPNVVALLENALVEARAGRMIGVGLVGVMGPGKPAAHIAGVGFLEINIGCDVLKAQVVGQIMKPSAIVRPAA